MGVPTHQQQDIRAGPPHTCIDTVPRTHGRKTHRHLQGQAADCHPTPPAMTAACFCWFSQQIPSAQTTGVFRHPGDPTGPWPPVAHTYPKAVSEGGWPSAGGAGLRGRSCGSVGPRGRPPGPQEQQGEGEPGRRGGRLWVRGCRCGCGGAGGQRGAGGGQRPTWMGKKFTEGGVGAGSTRPPASAPHLGHFYKKSTSSSLRTSLQSC